MKNYRISGLNSGNPRKAGGEENKLCPQDRAAHAWYRFVLSYPPHLVRDYLQKFELNEKHLVLDPFCGTGTTIVECKKLGIPSVGIEANPMAYFASRVKADWTPDADGLLHHATMIAQAARLELLSQGIDDDALPLFGGYPNRAIKLRTLPIESESLLLTGSISPLPLHKTLVLIDCLERSRDDCFHYHELLALAKVLVFSISNLRFGPEVGIGAGKTDAPVIHSWLSAINEMVEDLHQLQNLAQTSALIHQADARTICDILPPGSIDAVITSPPYPNEKDYTRTTRLESVILGFVRNKAELQTLKKSLMRSNTRNVYKEDNDDLWITAHHGIQQIAEAIEARRMALGKTSGFERLYARVAKLYFGGMARHLAGLRRALRPGARLAYVVGDQASYLRVMIRTGQLLADIAESLGYEVLDIELFRTRLATATKEQLREEVVVMRWPGNLRKEETIAP